MPGFNVGLTLNYWQPYGARTCDYPNFTADRCATDAHSGRMVGNPSVTGLWKGCP